MKRLRPLLITLLLLSFCPLVLTAAVIDQALASYEQKQYQQAEKQFLKIAGQGNADAQYYLGQLYRLGQLGDSDINKAVKYYQLAASQGHAQAMRNLGTIYYYGNLGEPDYETAYNWIKKSAEADDTWSQWLLSIMYMNGDGIEKDSYRAYQWASISAHKGHIESQQLRDEIKKQLNVSQLHQADQLDRLLDTEPVTQTATDKNLPERPAALSQSSSGTTGKYTVQFAAFRDHQRAENFLEKISSREIADLEGMTPRLLPAGNLFKVVAGEFEALDSAIGLCSRLRSGTLDCFVTRF